MSSAIVVVRRSARFGDAQIQVAGGFGPGRYEVSRVRIWKPAAVILSAIGRSKWQPPTMRFCSG
jgi:hypothetical protein